MRANPRLSEPTPSTSQNSQQSVKETTLKREGNHVISLHHSHKTCERPPYNATTSRKTIKPTHSGTDERSILRSPKIGAKQIGAAIGARNFSAAIQRQCNGNATAIQREFNGNSTAIQREFNGNSTAIQRGNSTLKPARENGRAAASA
jgi:hypothetical protein